MIHDILDLLTPKPRFTATASYLPEPINSTDVGAVQFNYEYVNPVSQSYRRLFGNIQSVAGEVAIRTNDQLPYKVGGTVITQDGKTFEILQIEEDYQAANKQAMRVVGVPLSTEYVMRLVMVDNPWGVK